MNVLSLFDGMSCGRIALERAGIPVTNYFASEIDKYAMQVSKSNWPEIQQLGSVTDLTGQGLPNIDLLIGGSPCQGFSFAGKQLNFEDPRSKLFFEYARLLKDLKPKHFLLENVMMKKEYQDVISEHLGVQPVMICSSKFSAQMRKRLYWTNIPIAPYEDQGSVLEDILENGSTDRKKSFCLDANYWKGASYEQYLKKSRRQMVFDGLGNARKLTPVECERLQTIPDNYTACVSNTQRYRMLGNGWTVDVVAHIFKGLLK